MQFIYFGENNRMYMQPKNVASQISVVAHVSDTAKSQSEHL